MTTRSAIHSDSAPVDHRTIVAAQRRKRMRQRLVENALLIFAEHGIDSSVINKVVTVAEVSRGTFYNYFRTDEELFIAVAIEVSNEILRIVNPLVMQQQTGAARVACGVRSVMALARRYPVLPEFLDRGGLAALCHGELVNDIVPRDLMQGISEGSFKVTDMRLALDLVLGPVYLGFHTLLTAEIDADYDQRLAKGILMALGVTEKTAERIIRIPLDAPVIPDDSLIQRAHVRRAR